MLKQQWVAAAKVLLPFAFVPDTDNVARAAGLKHCGEGSGRSCYHRRAPQAKVVLFQPTLPALMSKKLT